MLKTTNNLRIQRLAVCFGESGEPVPEMIWQAKGKLAFAGSSLRHLPKERLNEFDIVALMPFKEFLSLPW